MQLGQQAAGFARKGLNVAAISYDRPELLKHFSDRVGIRYPLLGDSSSVVIRKFDILNDEIPQGQMAYGVPHPGTYILNERGVVQAKYFEEAYQERFTPASVLAQYFGENGGTVGGVLETRHLKLTYTTSQSQVRMGNKIVLRLEVDLKPRMHVYAPGVEGYIPVDWKVEESPAWTVHSAAYPASKTLLLPAIKETVPVFEGKFKVERELTVKTGAGVQSALDAQGQLHVKGSFRYQACDDKVCYRPETVPLEWVVQVTDHDRTRAPEELRRK